MLEANTFIMIILISMNKESLIFSTSWGLGIEILSSNFQKLEVGTLPIFDELIRKSGTDSTNSRTDQS